MKESAGRYYDVLSGEDERGGGALLYHRMQKIIDITQAQREFPSSAFYLREAKTAGCWADVEKPFWWDVPMWLSTGLVDSVGLANNHMNRSQVLGNEAWGRPRDGERYPGIHGNGRYTQDLYYKILNCGLRLPPSAGSASGVLPNPVGYNRVYVHTGDTLDWERWWDGLRKGRSFVTNGPLIRLTANASYPGKVFTSENSLTVSIRGLVDSRDPLQSVELVTNGEVREIELPSKITIDRSGWFLVRVITRNPNTFRFASTAPWYVEIGGEAMKPDRAAARFFLDWIRERRAFLEGALENEDQRRAVLSDHDNAAAFWQRKVDAADS